MPEVILHIGFAKTATTWFQKNYYPKIDGAHFIPRPTVYRFLDYIHKDEVNIDVARSILIEETTKRIIMCEENILKGDLDKIEKTAKILREIFPDGKVIIFIRNQKDMVASRYLQYIKGGGTHTIDKFLYGENQHEYLTPANLKRKFIKLQYHKVIEIYFRHFKKENVSVYLYEEFDEDNQLFIEQFSEKFSLSYSGKVKFNRRNISYKKRVIPVARFVNHFSRHGSKFKIVYLHLPFLLTFSRKLFALINRMPGMGKHPESSEILGKKNLELFWLYFLESNRVLLNEYKIINLEKYNYPV